MPFFIGTLAAVLFLFLIVTRNYKKELFEKKEYFYSSACFLLDRLQISKFFTDEQKQRVYHIYIGEDRKSAWLKYQCKTISYVIYGILSGMILLCLVFFGTASGEKTEKGRLIQRPDYGEGNVQLSEDITLKSISDDEEERRNIEFTVKEKAYSKKEWKEVLENVKEYIDKKLLGENASLDAVEETLVFVDRYPDTSIKINWSMNKELIRSDGTIKNTWEDDVLPDDGVLTELTAGISCGEHQAEYTLFIRILPKKYTEIERAWQELKTVVLNKEKTTRKNVSFNFPETVGNYQVIFNEEEDSTFTSVILLCAAFVLLLSIIPAERLKEEEKARERQLIADYPKMLNRFVLSIGAGMTIRGVFEKLVREYLESRKRGGEKRYVFEEMSAAVKAMENGTSEAEAIESFGKRIRLLPYVRFTSLLIQNRRKGSEDLLLLLEHEAVAAMEQKRERMRIQGEEAGTKLLLPMVIMLCVVFAVIMIPAFMSF